MFRVSDLPPPVLRHLNGLWRRRWLIVAAAWAFALAGWFGVWLLPDRYQSRAQVYVQTESVLEPVMRGVTAAPDYSERVDVMRLQLLARPNVEAIIERSGLDRLIEADSEAERAAKRESLIHDTAQSISIKSPRDMYFDIVYRHGDPHMARDVVDAALGMLIEQDIGASLSENEAAARRLDRQIAEFETRLTTNENAVAAFRAEHAIELASSEGAERRRDSKEDELARAAEEIAQTRGRIITLQNLLSATPRNASGGELERLRVELADLRSKYEETHPDIRGVKARISELERTDGGVLGTNPEYARLQSELSVARGSLNTVTAREESLRRELTELEIAAGQAPEVIARLRQIEREYETTKKTYEELLQRRDRLQLTENLGPEGRSVDYKIFERPEAARLPVSPPRMILIALVGVLAIGAAGALALLLNFLDKTFTQKTELEKAFGLPVLGAIAEAPSAMAKRARRADLMKLAGATAGLAALGALFIYVSVFRLSPTPVEALAPAPSPQEAPRWG